MTDRFARDLLREMRSPVVPVESEEIVAARRDRMVSALRTAQLRRVADAGRRMSPRTRFLLAALVLLPSVAAATTWMAKDSERKVETRVSVDAPPPAPVLRSRASGVNAQAVAAKAPETSIDTAVETPSAAPPPRVSPATPAVEPTRASTLAAENALLQSALASARRGDDGRAVTLLTAFLTRYPNSELAQNAEIERFRALERRGDVTSAVRLARQYLGEHPDGMARDEARRLAVAAPTQSSGTLP